MEDVDKENTVTSVFVLTLRVLFVFDKIDLSRDGIIHLNLIDFLLSEEF